METLSNNCPVCNKERFYKSRSGYLKANKNNLPCTSCSNSIKLGGNGCLIKDDTKLCSSCHEYKDFSEFGKGNNNKLKSRCNSCQQDYNKKYHKNILRFDKYNISKEQFQIMLKNQNSKCAICNTSITENSCHIDHCHKSNK